MQMVIDVTWNCVTLIQFFLDKYFVLSDSKVLKIRKQSYVVEKGRVFFMTVPIDFNHPYTVGGVWHKN